MMKSMLESANEPVTDLSYFECLDSVMEKSKVTTTAQKTATSISSDYTHSKSMLGQKNIRGNAVGIVTRRKRMTRLPEFHYDI